MYQQGLSGGLHLSPDLEVHQSPAYGIMFAPKGTRESLNFPNEMILGCIFGCLDRLGLGITLFCCYAHMYICRQEHGFFK